jgi:hypothetical protein
MAHKRTLESLVKRASKPNKKITTASRLLPVHGLLSNVFEFNQGSRKFGNYWGPFSFDLAFTRCKLTSPGLRKVCNRVLQFRKSAQNGGTTTVHIERAREQARLRTCLSPHSKWPRTKNSLEC